jgi:hypothetical protein
MKIWTKSCIPCILMIREDDDPAKITPDLDPPPLPPPSARVSVWHMCNYT